MKTISPRRVASGLLALSLLSLSLFTLLPQKSANAERGEGLTNGLMGWWKFNNGSGATATDSSASANNGSLLAAAGWSTDKSMSCDTSNTGSLSLPGTAGSYVNVGSHAELRPTSISIATWFKVPSDAGEYWSPLVVNGIRKYAGEFDMASGYDLAVWYDGLSFSWATESDNQNVIYYEEDDLLPPGEWNHVVAQFDEVSGDAKLYVNGELKLTENNDPEAITYTYPEQELPSFIIGNGYDEMDGDEEFFFEGKVDDLRVYNRVIEEEDIMVLANNDCSGYEEEGDGADADGISDTVEDAAPNSGDANNDGTPDSEQNNVSSFKNADGSKYIALEVDGGCDLSNVASASESSKAAQDSGYTYPAGLVNFTAACESATVKLFFYGESDSLTVRKFFPSTNTYSTISSATKSTQTIGGQSATVVTYTVTDGGELDVDGADNGVIVDPVGLGQVQGLSDTGFTAYVPIILSSVLLAAGVIVARSANKKA